jgi:hypothetical protein
MNIWIETVTLGILASVSMAAFLLLIETSGLVRSKDFWVFGKLFSRPIRTARLLDLSCHIVAGILFAFLYVFIWSVFEITNVLVYPLIGLLTGILHGFAVSISQIVLLTDSKNGVKIAFVHGLSHAVFGLVLGIGVSIVDPRDEYVSRYSYFFRSEISSIE